MSEKELKEWANKIKMNCKQLVSNRICNLVNKVGIGCEGCEEYKEFICKYTGALDRNWCSREGDCENCNGP
jgi:hypothetical protein